MGFKVIYDKEFTESNKSREYEKIHLNGIRHFVHKNEMDELRAEKLKRLSIVFKEIRYIGVGYLTTVISSKSTLTDLTETFKRF